jgi:hypothetical protein
VTRSLSAERKTVLGWGRRNGLGEMMMGCSNKGSQKKNCTEKIKNLHYPTTEKLI